jgi:hydroxypyruvate isomerase
MAGDRAGIGEERNGQLQAILKEAVKIAEDHGVTLCMELLNSKVDHPGYMCDNYTWPSSCAGGWIRRDSRCSSTSTTCRSWRATSSRRSRRTSGTSATSHTAGVPGRHELDENQEIYYPAVMRAIVETGYNASRARIHPTRDPLESSCSR